MKILNDVIKGRNIREALLEGENLVSDGEKVRNLLKIVDEKFSRVKSDYVTYGSEDSDLGTPIKTKSAWRDFRKLVKDGIINGEKGIEFWECDKDGNLIESRKTKKEKVTEGQISDERQLLSQREALRVRRGLDLVKESKDPTKKEMMDFLLSEYKGEGEKEEIENDAEVAIYFFATDYHSGQWSNLYSASSTSPYSPGLGGDLESEGDMVQEMYATLENKFGK